jgi:UMF1 family MFS transporter
MSWALYDWANSAFATTVLAGFFPAFYKEFWSSNVEAGNSTFHLGLGNSLASIVIVLMAPVLGAIADSGAARKRFLAFFTLLGIAMTASLYSVAQGQWLIAIILFILATVGFSGGNVFYDSLIIGVAREEQLDFVSAYGYALGYLGGGLLFAFNVVMTLWPEHFGFADVTGAVRVSFLCVAVWWMVFSIPLFLFVPEPGAGTRASTGRAIRGGLRQLAGTFAEIRRLRVVFLFLIAYWLYIDGVDTIVRMAVDYGLSIGFDMEDLLTALLITQFVGFPAAIVFGLIGRRIGAKAGILIAIAVYVAVTVWAVYMDEVREFYGLAVVIGLVQGGVQALSRSFYARIIPPNKSAEFFGFYNMLGKFAAVVGPLMIGLMSLLTSNPRLSLLSIITLFVAGALLLYFVDEREGARMARELART